jgi:hypothetical protein
MIRALTLLVHFSQLACASSQKQAGLLRESKRRLSFEALVEVPKSKERRLKSPNNLSILLIAQKKDPTKASLLLENFTDTNFPRSCSSAALFADGVAVPLGEMKRSAARDGVSQAIATEIPREGLVQLASLNKVTGDVCGIEFVLSELQASNLRAMINATIAEPL